MKFLIEHQYVILYFSGAFFSFFAMLSYVKIGNSLVGGRKKMSSPEDFFDDFDNDDLEALLDESFDVDAQPEVAAVSHEQDLPEGAFAIADDSIAIEENGEASNGSEHQLEKGE